MNLRSWIVLLALGCASACGGGTSGGGGGDGGGDGGAGVDAASACGEDCPDICGIPSAACPDCVPCRYVKEEIAAKDRAEDVALHVGQHVDVAYLTDSGAVRVARRVDAGNWLDEPVTTVAQAITIDVAATDDGATRWVAVLERSPPLRVYRSDGGAWSEETLPGTTIFWASLDVGSDGQPVIALSGVVDGVQGVFLATRPGGVWQTRLVSEEGAARVAVAATDPVRVAWRDMPSRTVRFAVGTATGFAVETIEADLGTPGIAGVAVAVDAAGAAHVAYSRGSRYVNHATQVGGAWQISEVSSYFYSDTQAAVAVGADGAVHVGYQHNGLGIGVADRSAGGFGRQAIENGCSEYDAFVDLASGPDGGLHVAYRCGGRAMYATRTGETYPTGYWSDCTAVAATLCARACSCGACCLDAPGGGTQCTTPESSCVGDATVGLCGDATVPPTQITTCAAVAASAVCGGDGAVLPEGCVADF